MRYVFLLALVGTLAWTEPGRAQPTFGDREGMVGNRPVTITADNPFRWRTSPANRAAADLDAALWAGALQGMRPAPIGHGTRGLGTYQAIPAHVRWLYGVPGPSPYRQARRTAVVAVPEEPAADWRPSRLPPPPGSGPSRVMVAPSPVRYQRTGAR